MKKLVLIFFMAAFIIYFFTSAGKTPYDYFTRLADAFLAGKYFLTENPPWLSELIPAESNKYFVVYPPMPAILSMPFRFLLRENFQQQYLAHILGAGIVAFTILISWTVKKNKKLAIWSGILAGFGSIIWFLSATGSSWYLGQVSAAFFLTLAIYTSLNKKRPFLVGVFLGATYLSRIHVIISLPFFLYLFSNRNKWLTNCSKIALGIIPFFIFNFYYNYIRFGTILDEAYFILPKILGEENAPWFIHGVTNPVYIPNNLIAMLWSFPKVSRVFPFVQPSWMGLSIWITTPAFVFSLFSNFKQKLVKFTWLAIFSILLIISSHGGTGWAQFGYRFAVDFYPFLILLTIKGVANQKGPKWYHWLFLFVGVVVNLWGVLWINKFGWVSF